MEIRLLKLTASNAKEDPDIERGIRSDDDLEGNE